MDRSIDQWLIDWKDQPMRMPLLLRGARQVGKTYTATQLGERHFSNLVTINFELHPNLRTCFEELQPQSITDRISALTGRVITPGNTLLFLDEIQECPNAIMALRYFKEMMPELHVIGAGSLLEFALNQPDFRMPVGRVESLYLKPISFMGFLKNSGFSTLHNTILQADPHRPLDQALHERLLELTKRYFIIGGMPAVLNRYYLDEDLTQCQIIQTNILNTYRNDFGKYARSSQHRYLRRLFEKAPGLIAQRVKYVDIDPDMQARDLKNALFNLRDAGLINLVYHSAASCIPLNAHINEKKFKLLFLDVGLVKNASGLEAQLLLEKELMLVNRGSMAEQFVGQELLAYQAPYQPPELFYWDRDKKSSTAEVDYLIHLNEHIIPIEVKAGKTGRLRSLNLFLDSHDSKIGIQISQQPLSFDQRILKVPLYMVSQIDRLLKQLL